MNSYILLRDNKESSSLSLGDLEKIGLKASDLVWVECQSVGWRNPHEIAELRPLLAEKPATAPVLEEEIAVTNNGQETKADHSAAGLKKKLVYVELPPEPVADKNQPEPEPVKSTELSNFHKYAGLPGPATSRVETVPVDDPDAISTKYSQPLDEIKEMYVKNLQQKGQRKNNSIEIRLPKGVKKGLVYAGFALAGAVIMLLIKDAGSKHPAAALQNTQQPPSSSKQIVTDTLLAEPVSTNGMTVKEDHVLKEENQSAPVREDRSTEQTSLPGKKNEPSTSADIPGKEITEKKNAVVEEPVVTRPAPAVNLASQLSLKANDYEIGSFGGIRNLEMTLRNDSKYLLDKVVVELRYLNPEGVTLKTEDISFKSVYPGEAETVAVKKTKRGVKITYKISAIESKEIGASTTGL